MKFKKIESTEQKSSTIVQTTSDSWDEAYLEVNKTSFQESFDALINHYSKKVLKYPDATPERSASATKRPLI